MDAIGGYSRQKRKAIVDRADGPDVKLPSLNRLDYVLFEHEVTDIRGGDDDALRSVQSLGVAHCKETLDLQIDAADRLDLSQLIDGACHGDALMYRRVCQS